MSFVYRTLETENASAILIEFVNGPAQRGDLFYESRFPDEERLFVDMLHHAVEALAVCPAQQGPIETVDGLETDAGTQSSTARDR